MSQVSRCGVCRAFVQASDRFCWSCGSDLRAAASAPRPQAATRGKESDRETELTIRRAYLAQRRGQLAQAEDLLRSVLAREPDNVSGLSMLSEILRAKGDLVGAVTAAQHATEAATEGTAAPGAVARAREGRAQIEESVVRELKAAPLASGSPISVLMSPSLVWYRSRHFYLVLTALGLAGLFLAMVATFHGRLAGHLWFGASLLAAGWCYYDAETRRQAGIFWGPFVLCLGPFGLAIYLLATY